MSDWDSIERIRLTLRGLIWWIEHESRGRARQIRAYSKLRYFSNFCRAVGSDPLFDLVKYELDTPAEWPRVHAAADDIIPCHAIGVADGENVAERMLMEDFRAAQNRGLHATNTLMSGDDHEMWELVNTLYAGAEDARVWLVVGRNTIAKEWQEKTRPEHYSNIPPDRVGDWGTMYLKALMGRHVETSAERRHRKTYEADARDMQAWSRAVRDLDSLLEVDWHALGRAIPGTMAWTSTLGPGLPTVVADLRPTLSEVQAGAIERAEYGTDGCRDLVGRVAIRNILADCAGPHAARLERLVIEDSRYRPLRNAMRAALVRPRER